MIIGKLCLLAPNGFRPSKERGPGIAHALPPAGPAVRLSAIFPRPLLRNDEAGDSYFQRPIESGAGDAIRTRDINLGKVALYP